MPPDPEVLIVGAGPTGLMLALQLARRGVRIRLIDRNAGPSRESRAVVVQARTLEFFDQLGFATEAVRAGRCVSRLRVLRRGRLRAEFPLGGIGHGLTRFPFILSLGQDQTEALLLSKLAEVGVSVERSTEAVAAEDISGRWRITLRSASGEEFVDTAWLCGCDGSLSLVRRALGIAFDGGTYEHRFYLADCRVDGPVPDDGVTVAPDARTLTAFFAMAGERRFRVLGRLPASRATPEHDQESLSFEQMSELAKRGSSLPITCSSPRWTSVYRLHHRCAAQLVTLRTSARSTRSNSHAPTTPVAPIAPIAPHALTAHVAPVAPVAPTPHAESGAPDAPAASGVHGSHGAFILGDAAHVHSPVGGQGMNTGLQDATNLAWKLAMVLRGGASPALLTSYEKERLPVARRLLRTTDRIFTLATSDSLPARALRAAALALVLPRLLRVTRLRRFAFRAIGQIGIGYQAQSLARVALDGGAAPAPLEPGSRLPFIEFAAGDGRRRSLADLCDGPWWTLIAMGVSDAPSTITALRSTALAASVSPSWLALRALATPEAHADATPILRDMSESEPRLLVVRPDLHVFGLWPLARATQALVALRRALTLAGEGTAP